MDVIMRTLVSLAAVFFSLHVTERAVHAEPGQPDAIGTYALDDVSREVPEKGKVTCPKVPLVSYRGETVRYHKPLKIHAAFRERLKAFEALVAEAGIEVYGRAPKKIRHFGTYNCRRIGGYPTYISEHGLGNGIDVSGFSFGRAAKNAKLPKGISKRLRRPFRVTVLDHYRAKRGLGKTHSRFLRLLANKLAARPDIFRVMLGPGYPGHENHFHFDCGPYRVVDMVGLEG